MNPFHPNYPFNTVLPTPSLQVNTCDPTQIFICGEPIPEPEIKIEISSDSEDASGLSSDGEQTNIPDGIPEAEEEKTDEPTTAKYVCTICKKGFARQYNLRYHEASHTTENTFKCPECPKAFADDIRLGQHVKRVHAKGEPQICKICGKSFKSTEYLRLHSQRHSDVKKYGCDICGLRYTQRQHLKMHILRVHEGKSVMEVRLKGKKPFFCPECGKVLWGMCNYRNHIAVHSNEKHFGCPLCPRKFKLESYVKTHMRIHSEDRPYVCKVCTAAFRRPRDLTIHRAKHMEKTIDCKLCNRSFRCRPLYRSHMVGMHRGIPLDITDDALSCTICKESCRDLKALLKHVRIHDNEKPFECAICGEKFYDKLRIRRHIRQFHSKFAKKKIKKLYHCPDCKKVCTGQQSFALHRASHGANEPVECKICYRKFTHNFYLGKHMTVHKKAASTKLKATKNINPKELKIHKNSKCPYCPKKFKKCGFLQNHIEKHHKNAAKSNKIEENPHEVLPTEIVNVENDLDFMKTECLEEDEVDRLD